ncbi:hypothetical protein [Streptomyces luteireticuli]|uniref:hypothetical protein n=1 Tax=Streptomyces luteireticuli TaxID=173858 RepID=UPI003556AAB6
MTKDHARKNKAKHLKAKTAASFTSANAGTLHRHGLLDMSAAAPSPGTDMSKAAALVSAAWEFCEPCQRSLTEAVVDDPAAVLGLAGILLVVAPHAAPRNVEQIAALDRLQRTNMLRDCASLWWDYVDNKPFA